MLISDWSSDVCSSDLGPVGRTASASTDGQLKAEIYSWSRSRGLFAGIALDGAVVSIDDKANAAAYGPNTTPRAIFEGRVNAPSNPMVDFRDRQIGRAHV